jgi:AP-1 complex subunit mu
VIIYELLDEIMDHGYPQISETKVLKEFIKTESNKLGVFGESNQSQKGNNKLSENMTGKISWRTENIKYKNNEVYLDVVEKVNSLVRYE